MLPPREGSAWARPLVLAISWPAAGAGYVLFEYLDTFDPFYFRSVIGPLLIIYILMACGAGFWALVSRATSAEFNLRTHLGIIGVAMVIVSIGVTPFGYAKFAFGSSALWTILQVLYIGLLLSGWLLLHLLFATQARRRLLYATAAGVGAVIAATGLAARFDSKPEWNGFIRFDGHVKPPAFALGQADDLDGFFARADGVRGEADVLARATTGAGPLAQ